MLHAENVERQGIGAGSDDAILGDDAILLAAADEFAGEEKDGALAAIDQHQLVYGSAGVVLLSRCALVAAARHAFAALFSNKHVARREAVVESHERAGVLGKRTDYWENGYVFVGDGIEKAPIAFGFGLWSRRAGARPDKCRGS